MHCVIRFGLAIFAGFALSPAMAAVQTYTFTSVIDRLWTYDKASDKITNVTSAFSLSQPISIGERLTGKLTYDSSAPLTIANIGFEGTHYGYYPALQSLAVSGFSFSAAVKNIGTLSAQIGNDSPSGYDTIYLNGSNRAEDNSFEMLRLFLFDRTGSIFNSTSLPPSLTSPLLTYKQFEYAIVSPNGNQVQLSGSVINLTQLAPVPETETYALMLAGLGVMGFVARKKAITTGWKR